MVIDVKRATSLGLISCTLMSISMTRFILHLRTVEPSGNGNGVYTARHSSIPELRFSSPVFDNIGAPLDFDGPSDYDELDQPEDDLAMVDADDLPPSRETNTGSGKDADDGGDEDKDKDKGKDADDEHRKKRRRTRSGGLRRQDPSNDSTDNPFFTSNFDSDDAGFVDKPVLAEFNFTEVMAVG
ncbi:hypothetical protein ACG7TL_007517 [Trametes sanguinea]